MTVAELILGSSSAALVHWGFCSCCLHQGFEERAVDLSIIIFMWQDSGGDTEAFKMK